LWADLGGEDAGKAWRAVRRLAATPAAAVPFLRGRLEPVRPAPAPLTRELVDDLDSRDFRRREAAARRLTELGVRAEAQLCEALRANLSAEQRRRIEELLRGLQGTPTVSVEQARELRAVTVLRLIGTAESRRLLRELAGGVEGARLTAEARAALEASGAR
jgi:hypothetical protein